LKDLALAGAWGVCACGCADVASAIREMIDCQVAGRVLTARCMMSLQYSSGIGNTITRCRCLRGYLNGVIPFYY
jgi:hypothetical protein